MRRICRYIWPRTPEEIAMKFMFVIHHNEKVLDAMPEKEMQALVDSAIEYAEEIRRSGHFIVSNALQRTSTARTIRVHAGKVTATDGPFAETKEQVGGFFVIEAKDMDEACAIASRFPPLRRGDRGPAGPGVESLSRSTRPAELSRARVLATSFRPLPV